MHRAPTKGSEAFTFSAQDLEDKERKGRFENISLKKAKTLTTPLIKLWESLQHEAANSSMNVPFSFVISFIDQEMFSKQLHTYWCAFIPFTLLITGSAKNLATHSGLTPWK